MIQENNIHPIISGFGERPKDRKTPTSVINYSQILSDHKINFRRADNYLESGEIDWIQGWILDIAVIISQIVPLLERILPLLHQENTPFRLVRNLEIAISVLGGEFGYADLAKIMSIYPRDDHQALQLALQLVSLTSAFKGPKIPTDRLLSGVVHTRYGACKPIIRLDSQNIEERYIYDSSGNLIKEPLSIPFYLPNEVSWPFSAIASPQLPRKETVLQDRYKPMAVLKTDAKGSVRKGLWLEKMYKIKWCVIKEGNQCMISDDWGRDIHDRLRWQFELQKDLQDHIPVPKVYDLFEENGNSYLVMEFIKGAPLISVVANTLRGRFWTTLPLNERLLLLEYADQLLNIVETMHAIGYIHRDIMPNNFLIKRQQLWLIDLELAYSERLKEPFPPFRLGTPGFMSPEQEEEQTPDQAQDIYAIGANLILLLIGLYPNGFAIGSRQFLKKQLDYFIQDEIFVDAIVDSLSYSPQCRPHLRSLKKHLRDFCSRQNMSDPLSHATATEVSEDEINRAINDSVRALSTPIFINSSHLWHSRTQNGDVTAYNQSKSISVYKGLSSGQSGVLYTLAKVHGAGFSIASCMRGVEEGLVFIRQKAFEQLSDAPGGLFFGTAGMAIALLECLKAGLVSDRSGTELDILRFLQDTGLEDCSMATGLSGKGLSFLRIADAIDDQRIKELLFTTLDQLLLQQQRDGSWNSITETSTRALKITGWRYGMAGIITFLLEYSKKYKDPRVELAVLRGLNWLILQSRSKKGQLLWYANNRSKRIEKGTQDGVPGIILCFIKAYEVLGDYQFRKLAEKGLRIMAGDFISTDLTLSRGLVGVGELYLEAAKIFGSEEWRSQAGHIAKFLLHYFVIQNDGSRYWLTDDTHLPTAGLFEGNCGIIHFLLRYQNLECLSHPLLIV